MGFRRSLNFSESEVLKALRVNKVFGNMLKYLWDNSKSNCDSSSHNSKRSKSTTTADTTIIVIQYEYE